MKADSSDFPALSGVPMATSDPNLSSSLANDPAVAAFKRAEPIRFPHIPSRLRSPEGQHDYFPATGHRMRRDDSHEVTRVKPVSLNKPASEPTCQTKSPAKITVEQISQIAEYLRRKRDELEAENSELAISSWQQHQSLLQQKEELRESLMAIRHLKMATEQMRCDLVELGHCLVQAISEDTEIFQQFSNVCETFAQLASHSQKIRLKS